MFTLRYQDITIGSGPLAETQKVYKVAYTGWLAADGHKFDASADHPAQPVYGHDLQVVKGEDGKPKMEAGQPFLFVQGRGQVVPGFDNAFDGMHVGGKRRVFIPYQLAYGAAGHPTGDPKNPGIPPKADLIFDMELVDMMDLPQQPPQPQGVQVHAPAQPAATKPAAPQPAQPATAKPAEAAPANPAH
jgi:peptidylprolyl isomerase